MPPSWNKGELLLREGCREGKGRERGGSERRREAKGTVRGRRKRRGFRVYAKIFLGIAYVLERGDQAMTSDTLFVHRQTAGSLFMKTFNINVTIFLQEHAPKCM